MERWRMLQNGRFGIFPSALAGVFSSIKNFDFFLVMYNFPASPLHTLVFHELCRMFTPVQALGIERYPGYFS